VALPLLLVVILKGGRFLFAAAVMLVGVLGLGEFLGLLLPGSSAGRRAQTMILGALLIAGFFLLGDQSPAGGGLGPLSGLTACLFLLFLWHLAAYGKIDRMLPNLAADALALWYLPFLLGHLVWLRFLPQGEWWVLWLLAVVFAGDTAAFYTGRTWGRRKLYPAVSPGKTWEGTLGGLGANLLTGVVAGYGLLPQTGLGFLMALALGLGVVAVLGDLFESMLKRQAQVKDASQLLPGHGGMLDRLDSLLFAGPVVVYARLWFLQC
jgi:phosphatidate cytidylyltransferase